MTEYMINIDGEPFAYTVEAFADGETLGRVISDATNVQEAAAGYLEPFGLKIDKTNSVQLMDAGIQYRVIDA